LLNFEINFRRDKKLNLKQNRFDTKYRPDNDKKNHQTLILIRKFKPINLKF